MTQAGELLLRLIVRDFRLSVKDGQLYVSPSSELTEADREEVKAHRDELVRILTAPVSGNVSWLISGVEVSEERCQTFYAAIEDFNRLTDMVKAGKVKPEKAAKWRK